MICGSPVPTKFIKNSIQQIVMNPQHLFSQFYDNVHFQIWNQKLTVKGEIFETYWMQIHHFECLKSDLKTCKTDLKRFRRILMTGELLLVYVEIWHLHFEIQSGERQSLSL